MSNQCKVPNCANDWVFDIPDHWCENHWLDWFYWPEADLPLPDWMPPEADDPQVFLDPRKLELLFNGISITGLNETEITSYPTEDD